MQVILHATFCSLPLGPAEIISSEQLRALREAFRSKAVQSGTHSAECNASGPGPVPSRCVDMEKPKMNIFRRAKT